MLGVIVPNNELLAIGNECCEMVLLAARKEGKAREDLDPQATADRDVVPLVRPEYKLDDFVTN